MRASVFALLIASVLVLPIHAAETEIELEEGHVEVQLADGTFIGLSSGAFLTIVNGPDGAPESITLRAGAVQVMSGFGGRTPPQIKAGDIVVDIGVGAAIISISPGGDLSVTPLTGNVARVFAPSGSRAVRTVAPGEKLTIGADGRTSVSAVTAGELAIRARTFLGDGPASDGDRFERIDRPGALPPHPLDPREDARRRGLREQARRLSGGVIRQAPVVDVNPLVDAPPFPVMDAPADVIPGGMGGGAPPEDSFLPEDVFLPEDEIFDGDFVFPEDEFGEPVFEAEDEDLFVFEGDPEPLGGGPLSPP